MQRGAVRTDESVLVSVWVPLQLFDAVNKQVQVEDTDRSKFTRNALREKIERCRKQEEQEVAA